MPAHYITYPGQDTQIFVPQSERGPRAKEFVLDGPFLSSFGQLLVPRQLWQAMARYAAWIEPAVLAEWIELMRSYEGESVRSYDEHFALLRWLDPQHDTRLVRQLAEAIRTRKQPLYCVWSGDRLRGDFAVDHCMPFAAWPCNDLWNLLPARPSLNRKKADKLPSAQTLSISRDRVLDWWAKAYIDSGPYEERFLDEAASALPGTLIPTTTPTPQDVFDGLMLQRATLRRDQQLAEWSLC